MSYPGNTTLSAEVQGRILRSFSQTSDLVRQGNESEAQLGCEFILGMDPLFRPATLLLERLRSNDRPVVLDDLFAESAPAAPPSSDSRILSADDLFADGPADAPMAELSDSFSALPDLDSLSDEEGGGVGSTAASAPPVDLSATRPTPVVIAKEEGDAPATAASAAPAGGGLGVVIQDLLDRGNNEQILQIAENQRGAIEADPQLAAMVTEAQTRLETAQYVGSFLNAARRAQAEGKVDEAERLVAKARILDPDNPELARPLASDNDSGRDQASTLAEEADELPGLLRDDASEGHEAVTELLAESDPPPIVEAAAGSEPQGGDRIESLLDEGQAALDGGEFQNAIDIWSRIFLIDIDNGEASNRIEDAREKKAEAERQADEVFHEGVNRIDAGDNEGAAASFRRVLELQSGHAMASEYLEQLESGQVPDRKRRTSEEMPALGSLDSGSVEAGEEIPSLAAAVERDRVVAVRRTDRRLLMIGGLVSLLVVVGGFLLFRYRDAIFPNAGEEQTAPAAPSPQLARASMLFERGRAAAAIKILESIPAGDPAHSKAQALLTQFRAVALPTEAEASPEEEVAISPELLARRDRFLEAASAALAAGERVRARRLLVRASDLAPLENEEVTLEEQVNQALLPLDKELKGFADGSFEKILPSLWRRLDEDADNPDLRLLIADSYYNLALRSLQRGTPGDAAAMLQSALEVEPENANLRRMLAFAETYENRPQDLLYRIYVKYLPSKT